MTYYFQCSKCKDTKSVNDIKIENNIIQSDGRTLERMKIDPDQIDQVKCCNRLMRELTSGQYIKESDINNSGQRG